MSQRKRWFLWFALTAALMAALSGMAAANEPKLQLSTSNPAKIGQEGFLRLFGYGNVALGNNVLPSADLVKFVENPDLDQALLDLLPSEGLRVWLDNDNGIELGVGSIEIRTSVNLSGAVQVMPDLLALAVNEPKVGDKYSADGTDVTLGAYTTVAAGGSLGLPAVAQSLGWDDFRIGVRVQALSGVGYVRTEISGGIEIEQDQVDGVLVGELWQRPSETSLWTAGQGYAFDVGVQGWLSDRWSVGVAVANLGGRLSWDDVHYQRLESKITWDAATGDFELDWDLVSEETQTVVWYLPRRVEGTVGFRASDTLFVSAGIAQTTYFNQDGSASDNRTDFNANVVWEGVPFLPLAAGVTYSGSSGWSLSTGTALNLGPVRLTAQVDSVPLPNFGREVGISLGAGLAF